jgi:hypothetical protein
MSASIELVRAFSGTDSAPVRQGEHAVNEPQFG